MADPTTNYDWDIPDVAGDRDIWGPILNDLIQNIDTKLFEIETLAMGAVAKAGGDPGGLMTGLLSIHTSRYGVQQVQGAAWDLDASAARFFHGRVNSNTVIDVINPPDADQFVALALEITNGGAFGVTWANKIRWPAAVASPPLVVNGTDLIVLYTHDGGVTWHGLLGGGGTVNVIGDPPDPPVNPFTFLYDQVLVGINWASGDADAQTQIGFGSLNQEPSGVRFTVGAGLRTFNTGLTASEYWWLRHFKDGAVSAWVRALVPDNGDDE